MLRSLPSAIRERLDRSDLATWHSAQEDGKTLVVLYRKSDEGPLFAQIFDASFFDGFEDETASSMAATIVANEIEPPHGAGTADAPSSVDASLLPDEPILWVGTRKDEPPAGVRWDS